MDLSKKKWRELGLHLGVPGQKLDEFKEKSDPLSDVIAYWLRGNIRDRPVTWWHIVHTLKEVNEAAVAAMIEAEYYTEGEVIYNLLHESITMYMSQISLLATGDH